MENFKQFCINITNPEIPDVDADATDDFSGLETVIDNITSDIKNKLDIIDKISIPYIEGKFDKLDNVGRILEFLNREDIPDTMLNTVSTKVYDKLFNQLSNDERSIIAVLSVYILIYNFEGGFIS